MDTRLERLVQLEAAKRQLEEEIASLRQEICRDWEDIMADLLLSGEAENEDTVRLDGGVIRRKAKPVSFDRKYLLQTLSPEVIERLKEPVFTASKLKTLAELGFIGESVLREAARRAERAAKQRAAKRGEEWFPFTLAVTLAEPEGQARLTTETVGERLLEFANK